MTEGDIIVFTGSCMMISGSVIFIRWARPALDLVIALGRAFSSTFQNGDRA